MGVTQVLTELMANGGLDGFKGDELHLPFLLSGIVLIRKGALSAAAKMLGCVRTWGEPEIRLLKRSVEPDRLLNMVAEDVHGSFGKAECYGPLGLALGAILGPDLAGLVDSFYQEAPEFLTRVVGLAYEGRWERLENLVTGEPVALVWEMLNPYDPKAIKVLSARGEDLGYLRKSVAHSMVRRAKGGACLSGRIVSVLGGGFDVNTRLNIEVKVWNDASPVLRLTEHGWWYRCPSA